MMHEKQTRRNISTDDRLDQKRQLTVLAIQARTDSGAGFDVVLAECDCNRSLVGFAWGLASV